MRLKELKQRVYEAWERYHWFKQTVVQLENFKSEIRAFGDLRCKKTWEKALVRFEALNAQIGLLDAYNLILLSLNFKPEDWEYEYRHQIFEEFLMLPDALELIKTALEQLFSSDFTPQEREEANGFFELVQEQSTRRGFNGNSDRLIWQLAELTRTAASGCSNGS